MTTPTVKEWKTKKYKTQAEINEEIDRVFSPKKVTQYIEDGKTITVYEAR